jgi:hypothetical protein
LATKRKDLKPGTVFRYVDAVGSVRWHVPPKASDCPLGMTVGSLHPPTICENYDVEVLWAPALDGIDHPSHYTAYSPEPIDVIMAWKLPFPIGSAIKYMLRAGKKDPAKEIEDLRKAISMIEHEIRFRSSAAAREGKVAPAK